MRTPRVAVVGAGMGGLCAALVLAQNGAGVTVLERASNVGGKLRQLDGIDAGPTVLTMRPVLQSVFDSAGETLDTHLQLHPAEILARHAWNERDRLDLFADLRQSADAIAALCGAEEARAFLRYSERARRIHDTLDRPFMRQPGPSLKRLLRDVPPSQLAGIDPFRTLWRETARHFRDPRLRQLFGRYSTYCGSSPFRAPATLMLVSHVERSGVWLCQGGMARIAAVLRALCEKRGVVFRLGSAVRDIGTTNGRCDGVVLEDGERIASDMVLFNADVAALASGGFGEAARRAVPATRPRRRSFSAVTIALRACVSGFPLARHSVFFSRDYPAEFAALAGGQLPFAPTVYACAQDRDDSGALLGPVPDGERLLLVMNAPANGDARPGADGRDAPELRRYEQASFEELRRCGMEIRQTAPGWITGPARFAQMFPGTGGGLYGQATHGPLASFRRPGSRSRLPGLYLAGGSAHPGPGLSMAALSGLLAAEAMLADCVSTSLSRPTAIAGGMSMR
ncbi:NAD(P)/FAD-dependent oxidoreductase [Acetobacteraceae bacterium KSS8]|uniref:NAD(P)/FAD-dependent oxidoreductase n=1 Tax=Endosaccharibacter trunci TaxID=2812733 RepID=A0ABT1W5S8_9PROT|nr:NAD(P)/FAD-dependent oxidoreductase [Acetobacteraceae bacterium KSS8]